jgi:hypothetical protein
MFYWADRSEDLKTFLISLNEKITSINGVRFDTQASFAQIRAFNMLWVSRWGARCAHLQ